MSGDLEASSERQQLQANKVSDLLKEIRESREASARVEDAARTLARDTRAIQDLADTAQQLYESAPDGAFHSVDLDLQVGVWRNVTATLNESFDAIQPSTERVSFAAMGSTSATGVALWLPESLADFRSPVFTRAREQLDELRDIPTLVAEIRASLSRLSITKGHAGNRSVGGCLDEALGILEQPPVQDGHGASTLLPLRSAFEQAINALINRRPTQERKKKWGEKVQSLWVHCGRSNVNQTDAIALATSAETLYNVLSGTKAASLSRSEIRTLFKQTLVFLNTLLLSIDENRLRPV